ncbi:MAG: single-stranded DNA-binding protein [Clostridiales bacterium]|jgi:single-strand DNA-binding protein|nr:single-stranded DNA-binding protein [Clostridiales bacterium]
MNKVILVGRFTKDPEIRYSQSSEPMAVARYTLAVNRRFKRDNEPEADFIPCVAFGKQAEFIEKFFKKGMQIAVSGRISVRSWDDPQSGQRRWQTEVVVDDQEFTESRSAFEARAGGGAARQQPPRQSSPSSEPDSFANIADTIDEDDLPF